MIEMSVNCGEKCRLPRLIVTVKNSQNSPSTAGGGEVCAQRCLANDESWRQAA